MIAKQHLAHQTPATFAIFAKPFTPQALLNLSSNIYPKNIIQIVKRFYLLHRTEIIIDCKLINTQFLNSNINRAATLDESTDPCERVFYRCVSHLFRILLRG